MEQPIPPFSFDFADLRAVPLRVVAPDPLPLPAEAGPVTAPERPAWLRRLLPVFRSAAPMRIDVVPDASPVLASRVRNGVAAVIASAGADSGVAVVTWETGLAAADRRVVGIPPCPDVTIVPAEVEARSAAQARRCLASLPGEAWLVVAGDGESELRSVGLPSLASATARLDTAGQKGDRPPFWARIVRLPLVTAGDLAVEAAGGIAPTPFGVGCCELAMAVVRRHREIQP